MREENKIDSLVQKSSIFNWEKTLLYWDENSIVKEKSYTPHRSNKAIRRWFSDGRLWSLDLFIEKGCNQEDHNCCHNASNFFLENNLMPLQIIRLAYIRNPTHITLIWKPSLINEQTIMLYIIMRFYIIYMPCRSNGLNIIWPIATSWIKEFNLFYVDQVVVAVKLCRLAIMFYHAL